MFSPKTNLGFHAAAGRDAEQIPIPVILKAEPV